MKMWFDWMMNRRAKELTSRLRPWIPVGNRVADIGSGTGHNARAWRAELGVIVDEFDVADLHWVGDGPTIFDGRKLSVTDGSYDVVTALFVLQYPRQIQELLAEFRRVCAGRVLVIQSTYRGNWGRTWLRLRELLWGPIAFYVARFAGMIRGQSCPLISQTLFSQPELIQLFQQAGLQVRHWEPQPWPGLLVSRDLYVLEPLPIDAICQSSSPHVTRSVG